MWLTILLIFAAAVLGLGLLTWLGLKVWPKPFPPYPAQKPIFETIPLPAGLPAPVERFYRTVCGAEIPVIHSAVITGTARLRINGITFPARLRFIHEAGRGYRHYIETTLWRFPLLKVNERYLDHHGRMELPFGVEAGPKIDSGANLGLWGESIWLSPLYVTDPRVRWEAIDATTARLIVPFGETGQDSFTVSFDPQTFLIGRMEALRWKGSSTSEKTRWILETLSWDTFYGLLVPSRSQVTWADEDQPWLVITLTDLAYNVDVSTYIRARGP